jgi:hypothetical protein
MLESHYLNNLYPLQDSVLNVLNRVNGSFYLTGGTALGRYYLNHRFSDDLDFFLNRASDFQDQAGKAIEIIKQSFPVEIRVASESYVQLILQPSELALKVEFVNDVGYRYDKPISTTLFPRTDHWRNILSNKITALTREAPKDIADIIFLSQKFHFNWVDIIFEAREKDSWINELQIFKMVNEFSIEKLSIVNWINPPNYLALSESLKIIAKDILMGKDNSLAQL